jgi:hypothetical protein
LRLFGRLGHGDVLAELGRRAGIGGHGKSRFLGRLSAGYDASLRLSAVVINLSPDGRSLGLPEPARFT